MSGIKTLLNHVNSFSIGYNPSNTATAIQMETGSTFQKQHKLTSVSINTFCNFRCLKKEVSTCVLYTQMSQLLPRTKTIQQEKFTMLFNVLNSKKPVAT